MVIAKYKVLIELNGVTGLRRYIDLTCPMDETDEVKMVMLQFEQGVQEANIDKAKIYEVPDAGKRISWPLPGWLFDATYHLLQTEKPLWVNYLTTEVDGAEKLTHVELTSRDEKPGEGPADAGFN